MIFDPTEAGSAAWSPSYSLNQGRGDKTWELGSYYASEKRGNKHPQLLAISGFTRAPVLFFKLAISITTWFNCYLVLMPTMFLILMCEFYDPMLSEDLKSHQQNSLEIITLVSIGYP